MRVVHREALDERQRGLTAAECECSNDQKA